MSNALLYVNVRITKYKLFSRYVNKHLQIFSFFRFSSRGEAAEKADAGFAGQKKSGDFAAPDSDKTG